MKTILDESRQRLDHVRAIRRELHRHPEVGADLPLTRALVLRELGRLGLDVRENVGGGIVADLHGPAGGQDVTIALRADMDAQPVQEETGLDSPRGSRDRPTFAGTTHTRPCSWALPPC
jgi:metal-dependent amidase/aminoacylase/carboxypeptidase family protein